MAETPYFHLHLQKLSRNEGAKMRAAHAAAVARGDFKAASATGPRSAVRKASYDLGLKLTDERLGQVQDYARKGGVLHREMSVPDDAPQWARDNQALFEKDPAAAANQLWNDVERFENRVDSMLAAEIEMSLPRDLPEEVRLEEWKRLTREFIAEQVTSNGLLAQWAIEMGEASDGGIQPHVHIMVTMRPLVDGPEMFGDRRTPVLGPDGKQLTDGRGNTLWKDFDPWPRNDTDGIKGLREGGADAINRSYARCGLELRASELSYPDQGIDLVPGVHVGPQAKGTGEQIGKRVARERAAADLAPERGELRVTGETLAAAREVAARGADRGSRAAKAGARRRAQAEQIIADPNVVIRAVAEKHAWFHRSDLLREVARHRLSRDEYADVVARLDVSQAKVLVAAEVRGPQGQILTQAVWMTPEAVQTEAGLGRAGLGLAARQGHGVSASRMARTLDAFKGPMSAEQRIAVEHVAARGDLKLIVGFAGTGKSTAMKAAREVMEAQGLKVIGVSTGGKAARGLERSSGIKSKTLRKMEMDQAMSWTPITPGPHQKELTPKQKRLNERMAKRMAGRLVIDSNTVVVLDEAGMVNSKDMAWLLATAHEKGAKVVMIGDHEQLQPIGPGAAFRALAEQIGCRNLEEIRRQQIDWQKAATLDFAQTRTAEGIAKYREHGRIHMAATKDDALERLARDYVAAGVTKENLALASSRHATEAINRRVRDLLTEEGKLGKRHPFAARRGFAEKEEDIDRDFAKGDRIIFTQNDYEKLQVRNGDMGEVLAAGPGWVKVRVDEERSKVAKVLGEALDRVAVRPNLDRVVVVREDEYAHLDWGAAITGHKAQGASIDKRVFGYASGWMNRHLSYIFFSRHRGDLDVYAGRDEYRDDKAFDEALSQEEKNRSALDFYPELQAAARRGFDQGLAALDEGLGRVEGAVRRVGLEVEKAAELLGLAEERDKADRYVAGVLVREGGAGEKAPDRADDRDLGLRLERNLGDEKPAGRPGGGRKDDGGRGGR